MDDPVVGGRGGGERTRLSQVAGDMAVPRGPRGAPGPVQGRDLVPGVGEYGGDVGSDVAADADDQDLHAALPPARGASDWRTPVWAARSMAASVRW